MQPSRVSSYRQPPCDERTPNRVDDQLTPFGVTPIGENESDKSPLPIIEARSSTFDYSTMNLVQAT